MTPPSGQLFLVAYVNYSDSASVIRAKQEQRLAEHLANHPEDAGCAIEDYRWVISETVSPLLTPRHLAPGSRRN